MNPQVRADTFLLDTATGKIWQMAKLTDMKGEPVVWQYMERLDNPLDVINLAGRLGWKAKEVAFSSFFSGRPAEQAPSCAAMIPSGVVATLGRRLCRPAANADATRRHAQRPSAIAL
jgi:hypothetical protein